jgi:LytS/YehU family sensor histidine kinase
MSRLLQIGDCFFERQRWLIHVLFWFVVLCFYAVFFGRKNSNYSQTLFFISLLMPVVIGTTYWMNYYLIPRYLMKERFVLFSIYVVYSLVISLFLEMIIAMFTFLFMAGSNMKLMNPASVDMFFLLAALLVVVFLGMAIKMVLHWRNSKDDYQKLMKEKMEVELRFLKAQLHPHFLFNTLNNLYFLALEKSDQAPRAILALSEILDYVLHHTKNQFVNLEEEWKQVENYIALEFLRYGDRLEINRSIEGVIINKKIAPMMLITLIENSFKHGVAKTSNRAWINIALIIRENGIYVRIENNAIKNGIKSEGVGLKNLQNQIHLLYGELGQLKVSSSETSFLVELALKESL